MKYKLGEKHPTENLYRVVALKDFGNVKAGDIGGWVESEHNLSQEGDCWVCDDAYVCDDAQVYDNARVYDNAEVYGSAKVCDDAVVFGDAWVYEDAQVYDNARVYDDAVVFGRAVVHGSAKVCDDAVVFGDAWVYGDAYVCDDAQVYGEESGPAKREWVGLTDEEVGGLTVFDGLHDVEVPALADFARAIEAMLKEKNT